MGEKSGSELGYENTVIIWQQIQLHIHTSVVMLTSKQVVQVQHFTQLSLEAWMPPEQIAVLNLNVY